MGHLAEAQSRIDQLSGASPSLWTSRLIQRRASSDVQFRPSYFPPRSTLPFSFSFICLTIGSREASPVVWVVEAGGALLGTELCSWGCVAGRVAVADGGELDCAFAASTPKRKTPASSDTASVLVVGFIDLAPGRVVAFVGVTTTSATTRS